MVAATAASVTTLDAAAGATGSPWGKSVDSRAVPV